MFSVEIETVARGNGPFARVPDYSYTKHPYQISFPL